MDYYISYLLIKVIKVQVCDARGDGMKYKS
jgi:hypothetical protein